MSALLLPALVLGPLAAGAVAAVVPRERGRVRAAVGLTTAALTALACAVVVGGVATAPGHEVRVALAGWEPPLGIVLRADAASAALLVLTTLVGVAVSVTVAVRDDAGGGPAFWPLWLGLWAALHGVYVTQDLFNAYVLLELVTVGAVSLVALGKGRSAGPALRYLFVAVVGSLLFLLAIALVYAEAGTLDMSAAAGRVAPGPLLTAALALTLVGMGAKMALFPLHSWLPVAHPAAPAAVSAVLSALVVKAALVVLWRFWVALAPAAGGAAHVLAVASGVAGSAAVLWGGLMALRQRRLKRIVAYSTVTQVGYLALVLPLMAPGGEAARAAWSGGLLLVVAHGLAKAAMFLAAGVLTAAYGSDHLEDLRGAMRHRPWVVAALGVAGVSLAGLPPTLGFAAKWQLLAAGVESGQWWWVAALLAGGLLTVGYTAVVLRAVSAPADAGEQAPEPPPAAVPTVQAAVPLALAVAAVVLSVLAGGLAGLVADTAPRGLA
ncbi:sodium:proton antiporter [Xylanimonas oleitrophica]|uniref:Sodium:proton antiporter n=1 Tax=Xylanimonas oleitrophica TaxID=2607479 RepID=A0A2W5XV02_9MICO|nr:proton-conducting transporter membrane subunit [Xylanimonas oleitrophica]PZR54208.1 sodium:proton antiporter [Xylanimonas oleitrophica]